MAMHTKAKNVSNQMDRASKKKVKSLREEKAPLDKPNEETVSAMLEARRIAKDPSVKGYQELNELFRELKK